MDDKKKLDDEVIDEPKRGSGSLLAAARKQQNRTVEEIADELNLSATQIRTIELDQSEGLPEPTYVRGYIRLYARLLGMDVDEVLDHYLNPNWQKGARLDDMPRGIGSASEGESQSFFTVGKVFVVLLLAVILGGLWVTGKLDELLGKDTTSLVAPVSTSLTSADDAVQNASLEAEPGATQESNGERDEVDAQATQGFTDDVAAENQLSLSFTDTTWVDIRDADGNRLAFKNYIQGEDLTVTAPTTMSVFLGNANTVSAIYNGEPYDILKDPEGGVFARFVLGE